MIAFTPASYGGEVINRGDFNNDGIPDIIIGNNEGSSSSSFGLSVSLGKGDGRFQAPKNSASGLGTWDITIGDFNGDGKLDVALLAYNGSQHDVLQILLGNGDGTFNKGQAISLPDLADRSITTGDFNGDGKLDLAIALGGSVIIYKGAGNGTFSQAASFSFGSSSTTTVFQVRVGDFNGDGKTDLAVVSNTNLSVMWNTGNFTFSIKHVASADVSIFATPVDINQDGITDLLVTYLTCDVGKDTQPGACTNWKVMLGSAQKTFKVTADTHLDATYQGFGGTKAVDINGDGINDIVGITSAQFPAEVAIWLGNPDGTYQSTPLVYDVGSESSAADLVAADFNRDGKIDFAIPDPGTAQLTVLLNATPRAACTPSTESPSVTVCQPQDLAYLNSPVDWIAESRDSAHPVTDMQIYVDNKLVKDAPTNTLNESLTLSNGPHFIVTKAWDNSGANFVSDRSITVYNGSPGETCPVAPSAMNICLPTQGQTTSTSLHVFANTNSASDQITALQVYIDNNLIYNDQSGSTYVDTAFTVTTGSHNIVVKSFDASGNTFSQSRTIRAQ